jgi:hypothetical protein
MERLELRRMVEGAIESLRPRHQSARTPFDLQAIREELEDLNDLSLSSADAARLAATMHELKESGKGIETAAAGSQWWRFSKQPLE